MALALDKFVKQLEDSGIIESGKLANFIPPHASPKDADELAHELVRQKHLTQFQAQQVAQGRAKTLILGNYTLLDRIGAGGMGQVFKAQHRRMDRIVAIKMLPALMVKDAAAVARFEREVRAAAKLEHPNIVTAYDADQAEGVHFFAMQFVEGSDLSALVKKNGPFPVAKATNYILQAARGLEAAHKRGVIHRDIKPSNLLLDTEGTVKILDMGLARIDAAENAVSESELTGTGAIMGTVDFMAPEQAVSTKHVDGRADVYSLGCSLYYLIAGKPIYAGKTMMAKLLAHREAPIPLLRDAQANVSDALQAVFEKMVAKEVEDRYGTVGEVVAALENCGSDQAVALDIPQLRSNPQIDRKSTVPENLPTVLTMGSPSTIFTHKEANHRRPVIYCISAATLGLMILAGSIAYLLVGKGSSIAKIEQPDATAPASDVNGDVEIEPSETKAMTATPQVEKTESTSPAFSLEFNGTTSHVATPIKYDGSYPLTIEAVVNHYADSDDPQYIIGDSENAGFSLLVHHQLFEMNYRATSATSKPGKLFFVRSSNAATPHQSFHVASVFDGNEINLFVDGVRQGTYSGGAIKASPMPIVIGANPAWAIPQPPFFGYVSEVFAGSIREVRISKIARYLSNFTPSVRHAADAETLALYHFDEGSGDTAHDASSHGHHASIVGAKWIKADLLQDTSHRPLDRITAAVILTEIITTARDAPATPHAFDRSITAWNGPALQEWAKWVGALPPKQQVDAVGRRLKELNPRSDGNLDARIQRGVVTELTLTNANMADISPIRALVGLTKLDCSGQGASDLSPLQGMSLKWLSCANTKVTDLSPLRGMPLETLFLDNTQVEDISPLTEISTLQNLILTNTHVGSTDIIHLQKALPNCKIVYDIPAVTDQP